MNELNFPVKIVIIIPWFGEWPPWICLFLECCRRNPTVHWKIYSDNSSYPPLPANVKVVETTWGSLMDRINRILDLSVKFDGPYKLCDLKPAYGLIFENEISNYDFWGVSDLDVVFGRLEEFFPHEELSRYDVLGVCKCCLSGFFTLYRNHPLVIRAFFEIPGYLKMISQKENHWCDEMRINNALLKMEKRRLIRVSRRRLCYSEILNRWDMWSERLEMAEKNSLKDFPRIAGPARWKNGRVFHIATGREMFIFHFQHWKKAYAIKKQSILFDVSRMSGWEMNSDDIVLRYQSPLSHIPRQIDT